jgi:hypothetical protein
MRSISMGILVATSGFGAYALASSPDVVTLETRPGKLVVVPNPGWHINESYPWSVRPDIPGAVAVGTVFAGRDIVKITGLPAGDHKLRGCVCNASSCRSFASNVKIP